MKAISDETLRLLRNEKRVAEAIHEMADRPDIVSVTLRLSTGKTITLKRCL